MKRPLRKRAKKQVPNKWVSSACPHAPWAAWSRTHTTAMLVLHDVTGTRENLFTAWGVWSDGKKLVLLGAWILSVQAAH